MSAKITITKPFTIMTKPRRPRRTKEDIEKSINEAAVDLIVRKGFAGVQLSDITRQADIEPVVFYNRYKNLDAFYDEFLKKYDYWVSEGIKRRNATEDDATPTIDYCKTVLNGLITDLQEDKIMREILRWEIADANAVTERTAMLREMLNMQLVFKFKKLFREGESSIDIAVLSALMISGIYYLFLHRNRSTFCGIDLNDPGDIERMRKTVDAIVDLAFSTLK